MILVCPSCAATHSAEAWANDAAVRDFLARLVALPVPVQEQLFPYLSLFRSHQRALSWKRAARLARELNELVAAGSIAWEKEPSRPCTPALWAEGMAEMVGRKGGHQAHFTNHNYLRKIVWEKANQADAARERAYHQRAARGQVRDAPEEAAGPLPDEVRALIEQTKEKLGVRS